MVINISEEWKINQKNGLPVHQLSYYIYKNVIKSKKGPFITNVKM